MQTSGPNDIVGMKDELGFRFCWRAKSYRLTVCKYIVP